MLKNFGHINQDNEEMKAGKGNQPDAHAAAVAHE